MSFFLSVNSKFERESMTLLKTTIAALIAIASAGYVHAQDSGAYVGLGAAAYVTEPVGAAGTDLFTVEAKVGYNFNKYFGVEAQGSLGLNTDSEPFADTTLNRKLDYSVGAFAVARLPVSEKIDLFARGGIHNTQVGLELENPPLLDGVPFTVGSITETGFAVGAGAQYNFDKKNAIRVDYTYLGGTRAEPLSIGYVRKF